MPKISEKKRLERKNLVLESALKLFSKKGYFATTIEDIANHAKISKGYIYTYFNSKDEIFLELADNIQNISKRNDKFMENIIEKEMSLSDKLVVLWDDIVNQWTSENLIFARLQYEFWLESSKNPELKKIMVKRSKESLELIDKIILDSNKEVDRGLLTAFSRLWWAQIDGLVAYFISHGKTPEKKEMEKIREIIIHMSKIFEL
jgi:AcrR family transcriptional regulator